MTNEKESMALATTLQHDKALGEIFKESGFFQDTKTESQAIVKILAGREVGLQPIEAMTGIHIVKGKITLGANLMAAAIKKHPDYNYKVIHHDTKKCTIEFYEGRESIGTSEFTIEDAKNANVYKSGGSWSMYPRNMLFARAMSNGVKWYCPDVFGHAPVYVPEEMGIDVNEDGEPIDITPSKQPEVVEPDCEPFTPEEQDVYNEECEVIPHSKIESEPETESESDTLIPPKVIEGIKTPWDALDKIQEYAMQIEKVKEVMEVITKFDKKWTPEKDINDITETRVIKIVKDLTGFKYDKGG